MITDCCLGRFSPHLDFHLLRFPLIGETAAGNHGGSWLLFEHQLPEKGVVAAAFCNWRTELYGVALKRLCDSGVARDESESSVYYPRGKDVAYVVGGFKKAYSGGVFWGSSDAVKVLYSHDPQKGNCLLVAALFPQGVETWCQLLDNPGVSVRRHFATVCSLFSVGASTTFNDVTLNASFFKKFGGFLSLFVWISFGRSAAEEFFFALEQNCRLWRARVSSHYRQRCTTSSFSVMYPVRKHFLLGFTIRRSGSAVSTGISAEWV